MYHIYLGNQAQCLDFFWFGLVWFGFFTSRNRGHSLHVYLFMHVYQFLPVRNKLAASEFDYTILKAVRW